MLRYHHSNKTFLVDHPEPRVCGCGRNASSRELRYQQWVERKLTFRVYPDRFPDWSQVLPPLPSYWILNLG